VPFKKKKKITKKEKKRRKLYTLGHQIPPRSVSLSLELLYYLFGREVTLAN
jgi:hypothetical protein